MENGERRSSGSLSKREKETTRRHSHRPNQLDWEKHRAKIAELYLDRNYPLRRVRQEMQEAHAFNATLQMYKKRFRKWGLDKNLKRHEVLAAVWELNQRERRGKPSAIYVRGREVEPSEIQRYLRRSGIAPEEVGAENPILKTPTVVLRTPEASPILSFKLSLPGSSEVNSRSTELEETVEAGLVPTIDLREPRHNHTSPASLHDTQCADQGWRHQSPIIRHSRPSTPQKPEHAIREVHMIQPSSNNVHMAGLLRYASSLTYEVSRRCHAPQQSPSSDEASIPRPEVFWKMVGLLGWLKLQPEVLTAALLYLNDVPPKLRSESRRWTEFLVCLKLAQNYLCDEVLARGLWKVILRWCASEESFQDFNLLERSLLADSSFRHQRTMTEFVAQKNSIENSNGAFNSYIEPMSTNMLDLEDYTKSQDAVSAWEYHKCEICHLYRLNTLETVVKTMEERHGFRASIRSYRNRLARWGWKKKDMKDSARVEIGHQQTHFPESAKG